MIEQGAWSLGGNRSRYGRGRGAEMGDEGRRGHGPGPPPGQCGQKQPLWPQHADFGLGLGASRVGEKTEDEL